MTIGARRGAGDDEQFRREAKPSIVLNEGGHEGGSVGEPTPRASRGGPRRGAAAMAARGRMGPAVRRTSEPPPVLAVSRELDRIRVTHLETATPMPLTFIAT